MQIDAVMKQVWDIIRKGPDFVESHKLYNSNLKTKQITEEYFQKITSTSEYKGSVLVAIRPNKDPGFYGVSMCYIKDDRIVFEHLCAKKTILTSPKEQIEQLIQNIEGQDCFHRLNREGAEKKFKEWLTSSTILEEQFFLLRPSSREDSYAVTIGYREFPPNVTHYLLTYKELSAGYLLVLQVKDVKRVYHSLEELIFCEKAHNSKDVQKFLMEKKKLKLLSEEKVKEYFTKLAPENSNKAFLIWKKENSTNLQISFKNSDGAILTGELHDQYDWEDPDLEFDPVYEVPRCAPIPKILVNGFIGVHSQIFNSMGHFIEYYKLGEWMNFNPQF